MPMHNLTLASTTRSMTDGTYFTWTAAETTITLNSIDMTGEPNYRAVRYIIALGTVSAGSVVTATLSEAPDNSTWTSVGSVANSAAGAGSDENLIIDLYFPLQPYNQLVITRASGNAVVLSVTAELYMSEADAAPQDSTTNAQTILNNV